jgi:hypothetical protein
MPKDLKMTKRRTMSGPGLSIATVSIKGKFQDAKEKAKKGWVIFCDKILEWVNRKWSDKMVKSNRLVSDCITVSDKVFAILIAKENLNYWIAKGMTKGVQHGNTKYSAVAVFKKQLVKLMRIVMMK